jgi:hypothetical protein
MIISHFLVPPPFDSLPFRLSNLELPVEALNGQERVLYRGLHRDPELVPLLPEFHEDLLHIFNTNRQEEVPR